MEPAPPTPAITDILHLPNELLLRIFQFATIPPTPFSPYRRDVLKWERWVLVSLCATCRLFNSLVTQILYESLTVNTDTSRIGAYLSLPGSRLLHRTLQENSSLRQHCRDLTLVTGPTSDPSDTPLLEDFLRWLPGVESLKLLLTHSDTVMHESILHTAVQSIPKLEGLSLVHGKKGMSIEVVRSLLCRLLRLRHFIYETGSSVDAQLLPCDVSPPPLLPFKPLAERHLRKAPVRFHTLY